MEKMNALERTCAIGTTLILTPISLVSFVGETTRTLLSEEKIDKKKYIGRAAKVHAGILAAAYIVSFSGRAPKWFTKLASKYYKG